VEAISDSSSPKSAALLPNAAAALVLAGVVETFPEGATLAQDAIASGAAMRTLQELVTWTS
jgi:anthranilate phosphoribosyltransferase